MVDTGSCRSFSSLTRKCHSRGEMCSNDVDMEIRGRMLNIFNSAYCHSTARFAPINFDLQEIREKSTAKRKRGWRKSLIFSVLISVISSRRLRSSVLQRTLIGLFAAPQTKAITRKHAYLPRQRIR